MDEKTDYGREWQKSAENVDKYDGTLTELRKLGFSFVTGLISAGSVFELAYDIQNGVIEATLVLIAILYWLDIYYQNILTGVLLRAHFLEIFRLKYGITYYVSGVYDKARLDKLVTVVYLGLLGAAGTIGSWINLGSWMNPTTNTSFNIGGAYVFFGIFVGSSILIITVFLYARKKFKIYRQVTAVYNYFSRLFFEYQKENKNTKGLNDVITSAIDKLEYFIGRLFYREIILRKVEITIDGIEENSKASPLALIRTIREKGTIRAKDGNIKDKPHSHWVVITELGILLLPKIARLSDAIIYYDKGSENEMKSENINGGDADAVISDFKSLTNNV